MVRILILISVFFTSPVLADRYAWAETTGTSPGKACYQIINPAGSGVQIHIIDIVAVNVGSAAYWTVRSSNVPLQSDKSSSICNIEFGAGKGQAKLYLEKVAQVPGSRHAESFGNDGVPAVFAFQDGSPVVILNENIGMVVCQHTVDGSNRASMINIHWEEVPL